MSVNLAIMPGRGRQNQRTMSSYATVTSQQQPAAANNMSTPEATPASTEVASTDATASTSLPPDLDKLRLVLIEAMKEMAENLIEKALSSIDKSLGEVKSNVADHEQRLNDVEEGLSEYSDRTVALERICEQLKTENESLVERMESYENRSRRFNMRVTNILEGSERDDPIKFMANFFVEVLGADVYKTPPVLDLAHRIGGEPRTGAPGKPRVMIVRFHYFQDKARALKADRNQLTWRGRKVLFYPDYANATAKLRSSFSKIKSLLFEKKVRFRLVFPAVLKVDFDGSTHIFKTATDAMKFYKQRIADPPDLGNATGPDGSATLGDNDGNGTE